MQMAAFGKFFYEKVIGRDWQISPIYPFLASGCNAVTTERHPLGHLLMTYISVLHAVRV